MEENSIIGKPDMQKSPWKVLCVIMIYLMCHDLKFKECVFEMGISIVEMYSGVISFRALYVNIALLYLILLATGIQPNSWNIKVDGVKNQYLE